MTGSRFSLSAARLELLGSRLRAEGIERSSGQVVLARADRHAPVPLTFSQNRLWFLEQFAAHGSAYVIVAALRVRGEFRLDVFARACDEVVRRHESLRTVFFEVDGHAVQQVRDDLRAEVRLVDLRIVARDAIDAEVSRRESELVARPFDLTSGPLFRVELLQIGAAEAVVLLSMHHLVSDRWSMGVLMRELTQIYGALVTGRSSDLPDLPVQYPDFALWQKESAAEAGWESDLAYWVDQLRDVPADVALATDRSRPREKTYRGSSVPVEIPPALVAPLRELAKAEGATLFMLLAAAFKVLVSRSSGTEDVVVGTPVANRTMVELEPLIGFFVNTLALRTDLSGNPTFRDLLRRVSKVCLEAYEHQSIPFERLVEELAPERSLARTPVFQVMFSYQNVPFPAWNEGPVQIEPIPLEATKAEFDLLLDLFEDGETIWGRLEYSVDIFDEATAERLVKVLLRLLRGLAVDPDQRIGELAMLGEEERRWLVAQGSGPAREWPGRGLAHECFEERARLAPAAEAVRFDGQSMSYSELNRRANRLARWLRDRGVGRDGVVGVCLERSLDLPTCLLAVLKAGGAYLALDPDFAPGRLEFMVEDAGASVVLAQRGVADGFAPVGVDVVCVEDLGELTDESTDESTEDLCLAVAGEDLAYVTYTAGSTGVPKGVLTDHAAIRNRLLWMLDAFGLDTSDRVLQKTPCSFDVSLWELLSPLMCGASVVLARPGVHQDGGYLVETIRAEGVTTLHFVPSTLRAFLREPDVEACVSLRRVLCGREPLSAEVAEAFLARSKASLYNLYGPAEAGIDVTWWKCVGPGEPGPVPIGSPIANTQVLILDRFLQPVPVGVAGELHIGGSNLARGYVRPELTAERFIAHPFDQSPGARLYRTGDLARFRGDGAIDYLGRLDDQVRPRGVRIDLREVEAVLRQHERVAEAVVVVRGHGADDPRLVAYVSGAELPGASELVAFMKERLADYMVPLAFVVLPALPRTPIGTVDRAALPEMEFTRAEAQTAFVAPRDDVERAIAEVWRQLLGIEQVGVHHNFFELGGHSLLATKVAAQVKASYGVQLPIRVLFDSPTVAGLASWVSEQSASNAPPPAAIPVADRTKELPLSFAQELLCAHHSVPAEDPYHNVLTAVTLRGKLDEAALLGALNDIVARHEVLRARIVERSSTWVQLVRPQGSWPVTDVDLRTHDGAGRTTRLRELVEGEVARGFRIGDEPMVRGTLVRMADEESVLILVMHHLVTDNWSYGVLVHDLREFYESRVLGRQPRLPELEVGFADYAAWQQRELAGGALAEQVNYWRRELTNLPSTMVFNAPVAQLTDPATGHTQGFVLGATATTALTRIGQRENATLFMVLMAAFELLLSAYAETDDVAVTFPVAGRERAETAPLLGYFVNNLVVRADLSTDPSFRGLVCQVREKTLGAYAHQSVPLWSLDGVLTDGRDPFRIVFNLLNAQLPDQDLHGLRVTPLNLSIGSEYVFTEVVAEMKPAELDLALIMREDDGALRGMWLYSLERVDARVMAVLTRQWVNLIDLVAAHPDSGVGELRHRLRQMVLPAAVGGEAYGASTGDDAAEERG